MSWTPAEKVHKGHGLENYFSCHTIYCHIVHDHKMSYVKNCISANAKCLAYALNPQLKHSSCHLQSARIGVVSADDVEENLITGHMIFLEQLLVEDSNLNFRMIYRPNTAATLGILCDGFMA